MRLLLLFFVYLLLAFNHCADTSYAFYRVGDTLGMDVEVCAVLTPDVDGYGHAWVRFYGYNFETSNFCLHYPAFIDYDSPFFVSSNDTLIKEVLFP